MKAHPLALMVALSLIVACQQKDLTEFVNVFNGTGFHGHTYPGATTPFGLVQLSPDSRTEGWDGSSGYHYSDNTLLGFSHTHLSGTGCSDLGDFLFTPGLDEIAPLAFSHEDEEAEPGYYKVRLPAGITAEVTATVHTGIHRYTFTGAGTRQLLIDATHIIGENNRVENSCVEVVGERICAYHKVNGWVMGRETWLDAIFSPSFKESREIAPGKLLLIFPEGTTELSIAAGLSTSGPEGARKNRELEVPELDFDKVLAQTKDVWRKALGTIEVKGGPLKLFYTCYYHTFVTPNNQADTGVQPFYSTLSLWDTFRSWNPLQTLINPTFVNDMVEGMLDTFDRTGELPVWPLGFGETQCMIGYHSIPVIADAWLRGIRGFDGERALKAMVVSSNENKGNTSQLYTQYGYVPSDLKGQSVSQTLEFAYDDWCIARMAEEMGKEDIAHEYYGRAHAYRNVFDPATGFMRGKDSKGNYTTPFDKYGSTRDYTEAIPWQYRFFVPHDTEGLAILFGGHDALSAALDSLFTDNTDLGKDTFSDITGLLGQYAHGNEPSHHMSYLFNWVGQASKSQKVVRTLLNDMYDTTPEGICGNEDCGQMSAWYVLSSIGLYPVCPGTGEYVFAAPLFKETILHLGNGKQLRIKSDHPARPYIRKVSLNGRLVERNYLTYDEIMAGGELCFKLSSRPVQARETYPAPYSLTTEAFATTPFVEEDLNLFRDSSTVTLSSRTKGADIRYTLDGTDPGETSPLYTDPFILDKSARILARSFKEGLEPSAVMVVNATKVFYREAAKLSGARKGCRYTYHEGPFFTSADVLASIPHSSGTMQFPSIGKAREEDHFGYVFTGWIDIPSDGIWQFALNSDDGSVLDIDGERVVENDGSHSAMTAFGAIPLKAGPHPYRIIYLEDCEGQTFSWSWKAEDASAFTPVPADNLYFR